MNETNYADTTAVNNNYKNYKQYGWICGRCGKSLAPWVRQCDCSNIWSITCEDNHTTAAPKEWWNDYITYAEADNVLNSPNVYQVGGSDYWNPTTKTYENVSKHTTNTIHNGKTNYKE